jgi:shikimate dehydrogenase
VRVIDQARGEHAAKVERYDCCAVAAPKNDARLPNIVLSDEGGHMPDSDASLRRLAVLGSPIAHSLSPRLHRAAYSLLGIPFEYGRAEVGPGQLGGWLESIDSGWRGASLTMPLKREILPFLTTRSTLVDQLGVANTVVFEYVDGVRRLHGYNTDVDGIVRAVTSFHSARPTTATILGGGATAVSALYSAYLLGARAFTVYLRDVTRAGDLIALTSNLGVPIDVHPLADIANAPEQDFVVSTLPGGAASGIELVPASASSVLFDVAYDPWPSRIAGVWSAANGVAFSGLDMLVEQAISQVRLFVGNIQSEPLGVEDEIRAAMRASVGLLPATETRPRSVRTT